MGKRLLLLMLLLNVIPVVYKGVYLGVSHTFAADGFADETGGEDDGGGGTGDGDEDGCDDPPNIVSSGTSYEVDGDEIYAIETESFEDPCTGSTWTTNSSVFVGYLPNITLSADNNSILPGGYVTLTATPDNTACFVNPTYTFEVAYGNTGQYVELTDQQAQNTFRYQANLLGTLHFKVIVNYSCGSAPQVATSPDADCSINYCASNLSSDCAADMNAAWSSMIAASTGPTKYEFAFYHNFDGGSYSTSNDNTSNNAACGTPVNQSAYNYMHPAGADPRVGGSWTLGGFHVHPTLRYCDPTECLDPGPSSIDMSNAVGFPHIVRTYSARVCGGTVPVVGTADYPYGPNCVIQ